MSGKSKYIQEKGIVRIINQYIYKYNYNFSHDPYLPFIIPDDCDEKTRRDANYQNFLNHLLNKVSNK